MRTAGLVSAPADVVWHQLVDRDSVSGWLEGIDRLTGSGRRFATRRANSPGSAPIEGRVLELEPGARVRLVLSAPWRLLREIELEIRLAPEGPATRVDVHAVHRLRRGAWLLLPFLRLRAEVALLRAIRGFRAAVEDEVARLRRLRRDQVEEPVARPAQHLFLTLLD